MLFVVTCCVISAVREGHGKRCNEPSPQPTKAALPLPITSDVTGLAPVCLLNGQEERVDVALQSVSILA